MKQIDGLVTKDEMYRLISGFRTKFKISEEAGHEMAKRVAEMPTVEAITREQYHSMTERFFDEFEENGADEETLVRCIFIGLAFGKLELMLFGSKDGDSDE